VFNSRLLVAVAVAVAVLHCRRRRPSPVIVVAYTGSGCRLPSSQGYSTSPDCLGGEWERKFSTRLKRLIVLRVAIEFAIVSELFVVTLYLIVVAPILD